jgi:hypothetical protein
MKNFLLIFLLFIFFNSTAQEQSFNPKFTAKWAPSGLILGNISLQGEYNITPKRSLTAKIGLPVNSHHTFEYEGNDADFDMKAISFLAGYRMYLSKRTMKGMYFEPFFKYVHQTSEGVGNGYLQGDPVTMNFTNEYNAFGIGAQLGAQFFIGKRFVIDLFFLGPEINTATNNFKAVEVTNTIPWTTVQASEAEQDIKNFIDNFPFIRNKTNVMVNQNDRSIFARFKGVIPGMRTGISFGFAF